MFHKKSRHVPSFRKIGNVLGRHKLIATIVVQLLSHVQLFQIPWTACQASLSFTISQSLLKLMSIESMMPFNHLALYCLLLPSSIFPNVKVFSNVLTLHIKWPEQWNFSLIISTSNEYSGLISFRIDWFDILAVQGTLKSLLQHHSSKAPILQCSAFFMVQLSYLYMTTGETIALTRCAFWQSDVSAFLLFCLALSQLFFQGASMF